MVTLLFLQHFLFSLEFIFLSLLNLIHFICIYHEFNPKHFIICLNFFLRHSGPFDCHSCSSSRISPKAFSVTQPGLVALCLGLHPADSLCLSPLLGLFMASIPCFFLDNNLFWISTCSSNFPCARN